MRVWAGIFFATIFAASFAAAQETRPAKNAAVTAYCALRAVVAMKEAAAAQTGSTPLTEKQQELVAVTAMLGLIPDDEYANFLNAMPPSERDCSPVATRLDREREKAHRVFGAQLK